MPAAYVRIPKDYSKQNIQDHIFPHGGITFFGHAYWEDEEDSNNWWIGWDYMHAGDYMPFILKQNNGKKWTTREIFKEVKSVIKQLIQFKEEDCNEKKNHTAVFGNTAEEN